GGALLLVLQVSEDHRAVGEEAAEDGDEDESGGEGLTADLLATIGGLARMQEVDAAVGVDDGLGEQAREGGKGGAVLAAHFFGGLDEVREADSGGLHLQRPLAPDG